jgi:hypothetical protein
LTSVSLLSLLGPYQECLEGNLSRHISSISWNQLPSVAQNHIHTYPIIPISSNYEENDYYIYIHMHMWSPMVLWWLTTLWSQGDNDYNHIMTITKSLSLWSHCTRLLCSNYHSQQVIRTTLQWTNIAMEAMDHLVRWFTIDFRWFP